MPLWLLILFGLGALVNVGLVAASICLLRRDAQKERRLEESIAHRRAWARARREERECLGQKERAA